MCSSDLSVAYTSEAWAHFLGDVRYADATRQLESDEARYFTRQGRLQAGGRLLVRDTVEGSLIEHGELECRRCHVNQVDGSGWCQDCGIGFTGGERRRQRVEELLFDRHRGRAMPQVGFTFTGSRQVDARIPPDFEKTKKVFAASFIGNVIAVFHDPDALLDTPLLDGGDDTTYLPFTDRLPPQIGRAHV